NIEAERAILSAMLREPRPCVDIAIEHLTGEDVFYSNIHREIFKAICELYNETDLGVDLISVAHKLAKNSKLEDIGGEVFLAELYGAIATTANLDTWCGIVREFATLRKMINVCSEALVECYDVESEVKVLVDKLETKIFDIRFANTQSDIVHIKDSIIESFKNIQKILNKEVEVGIKTGFCDLDKYVIGFKPGEMFVLAARPSIGKTSLALNFIRNVALKGNKNRSVAFFSLEMTTEQITRRLLCTEAGVSESKFFDGSFAAHDMPKLTQAVNTLKNSQIFIDPTGGLTISELRAKARRLKMKENIELVVIDYLQLMKADGKVESRQQEVADISSGIKKLAKDLNVPVLVLAQLNREVEKASGPAARPKLSHLRESGAIEQDADVVAFLHRDRDEAKSMSPEDMRKGLESLLIIEKNRNGETGLVDLLFFPQRMEFVTKSKYGAEDRPDNID
ncbi:MAG: replicative DNA helicase, partial [Victivallaceae bacterium]